MKGDGYDEGARCCSFCFCESTVTIECFSCASVFGAKEYSLLGVSLIFVCSVLGERKTE